MASFVQTLTNSMRVFGVGPSTKWGQAVAYQTMVWGTAKWGEGSNPQNFIVSKLIENSQALTWDKYTAQVIKTFEIGSFSGAFEMTTEYLQQNGWYIVFTSNVTQAEDRDFASWTSATVTDATFTCAAAAGTTWNEV